MCEIVNNFHAEISEAWEEYRAGRMETWYKRGTLTLTSEEAKDSMYGRGPAYCGWKPEGFWVEIADLCIRLADTMGAMEWRFGAEASGMVGDAAVLCASLHSSASRMLSGREWMRNSDVEAAYMIRMCKDSAGLFGVDLLAVCELKMAYNATRPHRHGGKLA